MFTEIRMPPATETEDAKAQSAAPLSVKRASEKIAQPRGWVTSVKRADKQCLALQTEALKA